MISSTEPERVPAATPSLDAAAFERHYGEPLQRVLDLDSWRSGMDLNDLYARLEEQLGAAIAQEDRVAEGVRRTIFPQIGDRDRPGAPPLAGVWQLRPDQLERVHRGALFCGDVEACQGVVHYHRSLALSIAQIGVCLVGYRGDEGSWSHRLFHRDLRETSADPIAEATAMLNRRQEGLDGRADHLAELGRRGLLAYAQRAVLTHRATAAWRMGEGSPAPFELLSGAGAVDLLDASLELLRELLLRHKRFVFVHAAPHDRGLLTIGQALRPLEFAIVRTLRRSIEGVVEDSHLRGERLANARDFVASAGAAVAVGVFKASRDAPPYLFYAPAEPELCAQAATIAMADAVLQEERGSPLLLDMARRFCRGEFGRDVFGGTLQAAYAAHGRPAAYMTEL